MYKVVVSNQCSCFKIAIWMEHYILNHKMKQKLKLCKWLKKMNKEFCGKHKFEVQEMFTSYVISFYNPARDNC